MLRRMVAGVTSLVFLVVARDSQQLGRGGIALDLVGARGNDAHVAPDIAEIRDDAVEGWGVRALCFAARSAEQRDAQSRAVVRDQQVFGHEVEGEVLSYCPASGLSNECERDFPFPTGQCVSAQFAPTLYSPSSGQRNPK